MLFECNQEQMKRTKQLASSLNIGNNSSLPSKQASTYSEKGTNNDCLIIKASREVKVFLRKQIALVRRFLEEA